MCPLSEIRDTLIFAFPSMAIIYNENNILLKYFLAGIIKYSMPASNHTKPHHNILWKKSLMIHPKTKIYSCQHHLQRVRSHRLLQNTKLYSLCYIYWRAIEVSQGHSIQANQISKLHYSLEIDCILKEYNHQKPMLQIIFDDWVAHLISIKDMILSTRTKVF